VPLFDIKANIQPKLYRLEFYIPANQGGAQTVTDRSANKPIADGQDHNRISSRESSKVGGQPSIVDASAVPCDSPQVVTLNILPNVLPAIFHLMIES